MTTNKTLDVQAAIDLLKSGGSIEQMVISDLATSKVEAIDAMLLAKNGCLVPDGNIFYDDDNIQYDSDFDEVNWSGPVPFKQMKESLSSGTAQCRVLPNNKI
jgi:hypothetical protein